MQRCRYEDVLLSHRPRYDVFMEKSMTLSKGRKIRGLREAAGMTQEKLAIMSNVDRRTVQRAEQGSRLQMESLASLAATLNVPVAQIITVEDGLGEIDEVTAKSLVVLNRIQSGIKLINIVRDSYEGKITCEADPTMENIDDLTAIVGGLERLMPQPWRKPSDEVEFLLSERLRTAVVFGEQLKNLEAQGVAFYAGTYTAQAQVPSMDYETHAMFITNRTPFELVTMCVIIVAPADRGDRITVQANNIYVPPASKASGPEALQGPQSQLHQGDDIPF